LRDLGTEGALYADVAIKKAINDGVIPGPRLFIATRAIVASGSYGPSPRSYRDDVDLPKGAQEASGVDEVVKAVREQGARGADWIKVYAEQEAAMHKEELERQGKEHTARAAAASIAAILFSAPRSLKVPVF